MKAKFCKNKGCNALEYHGTVACCLWMSTRTGEHLLVQGKALWKLTDCPRANTKKEPIPEKVLISKVKRDSQGLTYTYIPARIRDILDMQTGQEFQISTNGKSILLTPISEVTISA